MATDEFNVPAHVTKKLKELGYTKVQVLGKDGFTPCAL